MADRNLIIDLPKEWVLKNTSACRPAVDGTDPVHPLLVKTPWR